MEDKEIYISVAKLEERFCSLSRDVEKMNVSIDQCLGKLTLLEAKTERLFLIDVKKIILTVFSVCLIYLTTMYLDSKLSQDSQLTLKITEEEVNKYGQQKA